MIFADVFGLNNPNAEKFIINKDHVVSLLDQADVDYLICHDVIDGTWHIDIVTDRQSQMLSMTYNNKGDFVSMNVVHTSSMEALVGACLCAAFSCQQFDNIRRHAGSNLFPLSHAYDRTSHAE